MGNPGTTTREKPAKQGNPNTAKNKIIFKNPNYVLIFSNKLLMCSLTLKAATFEYFTHMDVTLSIK